MRAWEKYGAENFEITTITECKIEELHELEKYYIKELHSHMSEWGYNISWGGDSPMRGRKQSDEARKKISDAGKGNKYRLGTTASDETRKKMSESKKGNRNSVGKIPSDETRKKLSIATSGENNHNFGKSMSDETKKKLSESQKKRWEKLRNENKKNISLDPPVA